MSSGGSEITADMGIIAVFEHAIDLVRDDIRISGLKTLSAVVSVIPLIGSFVQIAIEGLAVQIADEPLRSRAPENSFGMRYLYVFVSVIIVLIIVFIGLLLLVLPGIFFSLKLSLVVPSVWVGDQGPIEALSDSWNRTEGNVLTVFGVQLATTLATAVIVVPVFVATAPIYNLDRVFELAQQNILIAFPEVFLAVLLTSATIGAVGTAATVVMYRSFGLQTNTEDFGEPSFQTN